MYNDLNEGQKGRVSFTSNFLAGDASLHIVSLQPSDAGQYTCKVKNAGQYEWYRITLIVLGKVVLLFFKRKHTRLNSLRQILLQHSTNAPELLPVSHDQVSHSSFTFAFAFSSEGQRLEEA